MSSRPTRPARGGAGWRLAAALLGVPVAAHAQDRLVGVRETVAGVVAEHVRFNGLLRLDQLVAGDSVLVRGLSQVQLPVVASTPLGTAWTLDLTSYYTATGVRLDDRGRRREVWLAGPGDTRIRAVGRLREDRLAVTAAVNIPSGMHRLSSDAMYVLRVAAAPALGLASPPATTGLGGTLGVVLTGTVAGWGVASGASYEMRGRYQPVAARLLGTTPAAFTPGGTVRGTVALDRLLGAHRLVVNAAADVFLDDILEEAAGQAVSRTTVRPGSVLSVEGDLVLAVPGMREVELWTLARMRNAFRRDGVPLDGSRGYYVDGGVRGSIPVTAGVDITTALDLRWQSGLLVNPGVLTMGGTSGVGTLGLSWRRGGLSVQPFLRVQGGNLKQRLRRDALPLADSDYLGGTLGVLASRRF